MARMPAYQPRVSLLLEVMMTSGHPFWTLPGVFRMDEIPKVLRCVVDLGVARSSWVCRIETRDGYERKERER